MIREPAITIINGKRPPGQTEPLLTSEVNDEGAAFVLWRELRDLPVVARFTVDGEPVSKSRARFTNRGSKAKAYTPEKTLQAEQIVGWKFRAVARGHQLDPEATYGVIALFFCGTRQRRDVDNMLKLILDGLNKVAWPDDEQVTEVSARKTLTLPEGARTEVVIYRVGYVQRHTIKCERCGKEFATFPSWENTGQRRRFCSRECAYAWRRESKRQDCPQCGESFIRAKPGVPQTYCGRSCADAARRVTLTCNQCGIEFTKQRCHLRAQNYCSTECQVTAARERRKQGAKGICEVCGDPTSKKTYRRCNACKLAGLSPSGKPQVVVT